MRDFKNIFYTDVRELKEFSRCGYNYSKIEEGEDYMIWKMEKDNIVGYELWRPKWRKNPDGSKVWVKLSDEDFGTCGWYNSNLVYLKEKYL